MWQQWTEIEVIGIAAHGSRSQLDKDAILKTGPILVALSEFNKQLRTRAHPRLGPGFVHASIIQGGRAESTIPDRSVLTIERRTLPGETVQDIERELDDLLATCRTADPELQATAHNTVVRPAFQIADDHRLTHIVATAATNTFGRPAETTESATGPTPRSSPTRGHQPCCSDPLETDISFTQPDPVVLMLGLLILAISRAQSRDFNRELSVAARLPAYTTNGPSDHLAGWLTN